MFGHYRLPVMRIVVLEKLWLQLIYSISRRGIQGFVQQICECHGVRTIIFGNL